MLIYEYRVRGEFLRMREYANNVRDKFESRDHARREHAHRPSPGADGRQERAEHGGRGPAGAVVPRSYAGNDTAHLYGAGIPCCLYGPAAEYDEKTADR